MKQYQKLYTSTKKVNNRGKRSKAVNEVRPTEIINRNLKCFLVQNEVPSSHKLQDQAY